MSFDSAATALITGTGLTIYGCYKYGDAQKKEMYSPGSASKQKKVAILCMTIGIATISLGFGLIYVGKSQNTNSGQSSSIDLNDTTSSIEVMKRIFTSSRSMISDAHEASDFSLKEINDSSAVALNSVAKCSLDSLKNFIDENGSQSMIAKTFKVLNETRGVLCENYLPWKNQFLGNTGYIDGIKPSDLQKSVVWGVDSHNRLYIAFKYFCETAKEKALSIYQRNNVSEGLMVVFQRYSHYHHVTSAGHHGACDLGYLDPTNNNTPEYLGNLTMFLKEGRVVSNVWNNIVTILNLSK